MAKRFVRSSSSGAGRRRAYWTVALVLVLFFVLVWLRTIPAGLSVSRKLAFEVQLNWSMAGKADPTPEGTGRTPGLRSYGPKAGGLDCTPKTIATAQDNPELSLEDICAASPWLLSPRSTVFSYSGVTDEEQLLALRARPFRQYNKTLTLFGFTKSWAALAQNYLYSLVRFAEATNYLAMTWSPQDHAACLDLNLPCWDVTRFLPWKSAQGSSSGGGGGGSSEALFNTQDYNAICWMRPRVVAYLTSKGFVVHMSDVDIAYSTKPLWESYIRFIEDGEADMGIGQEYWTANGGNYMVLPTPGGKAFTKRWADAATLYNNSNDQLGLDKLTERAQATGKPASQTHVFCHRLADCAEKREEAYRYRNSTAVIRAFPQSWTYTVNDICFLEDPRNPQAMPLDVCNWSTMFIHILCNTGSAAKIASIKGAGFWFMDDSSAEPRQLPRLTPLRFRDPHAEDRFWYCKESNQHPLGFTYIPFPERQAGIGSYAQAPIRYWLQAEFDKIYRDVGQPANEGPGTQGVQVALEQVIQEYDVQTMADVGCGVLSWMPLLQQKVQASRPKFQYLGLDIVTSIVSRNAQAFVSNSSWRFDTFDVTSAPVPAGVDLVFVRGTLQHLPCRLVVDSLCSIASSAARYLLVDSSSGSENRNIKAGELSPLNLRAAPYSLVPSRAWQEVQGSDSRVLLLFSVADLRKEDFGAMKARCYTGRQ